MDASELVIPAEVVEGGGSVIVSVGVSPSIGGCSSVVDRREEATCLYIPESTCGNRMAELPRSSNQLFSSHCQDAPQEVKLASISSSPLSISSLEGKQVRRRSGKMESSSGCSKRSRLGQMEDLSMNEADFNDVKEKSQMDKIKNGLSGKRVDRRNGKVSMKSKYDFFSLKAGMVSFNSGGGGNNSSGISGLKPDVFDITKHLDEVAVKELIDGRYKGPTLATDKGKRPENLNDGILNSVRNVCSILQRKKPLKVQSSAENDNTYNSNLSAAPMCVDASKNDDEKGDTCITDLSYDGKVQLKVLDFPLCQPKDILECVGLPPPVDLVALLVDASKPSIFRKDSFESRGKQISQRTSLPFSDTIKLSTNKSVCHGKWAKVDNTSALFEGKTSFINELACLNYDPKLVPVESMKHLPVINYPVPCTSNGFPLTDFCSSSSATCSRASQLSPELGGSLQSEEDAGDSPRALVAAETLCEILKQFPKKEQNQRMSWTSKLSDNTIKGCRSKIYHKNREILSKPESVVSSRDISKFKDTSSIYKKPRLLNNEKGKDLTNGTKGLANWSMPRSSTQSPSRSYRDAYANVKSYNSFVMPPPPTSKVFNKDCNNRQRLR